VLCVLPGLSQQNKGTFIIFFRDDWEEVSRSHWAGAVLLSSAFYSSSFSSHLSPGSTLDLSCASVTEMS
jgi:hypothetical protein